MVAVPAIRLAIVALALGALGAVAAWEWEPYWFPVQASVQAQRHDEIYGRARLEGHVPLLHGVTDHGDVQPVGACAQAVQHEPSVPVRQDRTAGILDDDQHSLQPEVRPGVDDASAQSGGRLAGVECNAEQQKNQRKSHTEELYTKL